MDRDRGHPWGQFLVAAFFSCRSSPFSLPFMSNCQSVFPFSQSVSPFSPSRNILFDLFIHFSCLPPSSISFFLCLIFPFTPFMIQSSFSDMFIKHACLCKAHILLLGSLVYYFSAHFVCTDFPSGSVSLGFRDGDTVPTLKHAALFVYAMYETVL